MSSVEDTTKIIVFLGDSPFLESSISHFLKDIPVSRGENRSVIRSLQDIAAVKGKEWIVLKIPLLWTDLETLR